MSTETVICAMCGTPMPSTAEFCPLCRTPNSYSDDGSSSQPDDFDFASMFAQADSDGNSAGASNVEEDASFDLDLMSLFAQGDEPAGDTPTLDTDVPAFASPQVEEPLPPVKASYEEPGVELADAAHEEVAQPAERAPSPQSSDDAAEEEDDLYDFSSLFAATDEAPPASEPAAEDILPVEAAPPSDASSSDEATLKEADFDEADTSSLLAEAETAADDTPPVLLETTPSNANDLEVATIDVTAFADTTPVVDTEAAAPEAQAEVPTLPAVDLAEADLVPPATESSTQDEDEQPISSDEEAELAPVEHTPEPEMIQAPLLSVQEEEASQAIPTEAQAETAPDMPAVAVDEPQDEVILEAEAPSVVATQEATPDFHEEASPAAAEIAPDLPAEDAVPMQAIQPIAENVPMTQVVASEQADVAEFAAEAEEPDDAVMPHVEEPAQDTDEVALAADSSAPAVVEELPAAQIEQSETPPVAALPAEEVADDVSQEEAPVLEEPSSASELVASAIQHGVAPMPYDTPLTSTAEGVDTPELPPVLEAQPPVEQDTSEAASILPLPHVSEDSMESVAVQSADEDAQAAQAPPDINAVIDRVPSEPVAVPMQDEYVEPQTTPDVQQADLPAFAHADVNVGSDALQAEQETDEQETTESAPVQPIAAHDEYQEAEAVPAQATMQTAESSVSQVEEPTAAPSIEPQAEQLDESVSTQSTRAELDTGQLKAPYSADAPYAVPLVPGVEEAVSVALPAPEEATDAGLDEESVPAPNYVEASDDYYHTAQAEEIAGGAHQTSEPTAEAQAIEAPVIAEAAEHLDDAAMGETPIPLAELAATPAFTDVIPDTAPPDATMSAQESATSEQPPLAAPQQAEADRIEDTEVVEDSGIVEQPPASMAAPVLEADQKQDSAYEAPSPVKSAVTLPLVLDILPEIVPEYEPIPTPFGRAGSPPSAPVPDPTPFPPDIEVAPVAEPSSEPEPAYVLDGDNLPYEQPTTPSASGSEADDYDLSSLFADIEIEEEGQSSSEEGSQTEPAPVALPNREVVDEQPLATDYDSHHEDLSALFAHTEMDDTSPAAVPEPPPTSTPIAATATDYSPPTPTPSPEPTPTIAAPAMPVEQTTPAQAPAPAAQPPVAQQAPPSSPPTPAPLPLPGIPKPPGAGVSLDVLTAQFRPTKAIKLLPDDLMLADEPPAPEPPTPPVQPMASAPAYPSMTPATPPTSSAPEPASVAAPSPVPLSSSPAGVTTPYAAPAQVESMEETTHRTSTPSIPTEEPKFDVPAFARPEPSQDEPHFDSPVSISTPPTQQAASDSTPAVEHLPPFVLTPEPVEEAPPPPAPEDDLAALFASIEIEDDEEESDTAPVFAAELETEAPATERAVSAEETNAVPAPSPQPTQADEHDLAALFADMEVEAEPAPEEPLFEDPFKVAQLDDEGTLRGPVIETIPPAQASRAEPEPQFPPDPFESPTQAPAAAQQDPVAWPEPAFNQPSEPARSGPVYTTAYHGATPPPPVSWEQAAGLQPGAPRPKPGTPEYEAMVQAALAARSGATPPAPTPGQATPAPQPYQAGPLPQQPPTPTPAPQPAAPAWDPSKPRPKPGTPEYEAMVQAALAARSGATPPAAAPAPAQATPPGTPTFNDPYQPPTPTPAPATPAAPAWDPSKPRPKPGTPEYEAMVQAILAQQRGASAANQPQASPHQTGPLPQQPPAPSTPTPPATPAAPAWDPSKPRPKPGTPEYEEMVQAALRARLGQNPGSSNT